MTSGLYSETPIFPFGWGLYNINIARTILPSVSLISFSVWWCFKKVIYLENKNWDIQSYWRKWYLTLRWKCCCPWAVKGVDTNAHCKRYAPLRYFLSSGIIIGLTFISMRRKWYLLFSFLWPLTSLTTQLRLVWMKIGCPELERDLMASDVCIVSPPFLLHLRVFTSSLYVLESKPRVSPRCKPENHVST